MHGAEEIVFEAGKKRSLSAPHATNVVPGPIFRTTEPFSDLIKVETALTFRGCLQTDRQTDIQTDRQTDRQTDTLVQPSVALN